MVYKAQILVGKNKIASVSFVDQTTFMRYISDMEMVKGKIADANADFEAKVVIKSERDKRYLSWFSLCRLFRKNWGDKLVLSYIRWALNNVEENMGHQLTKFS